MAMNRGLWVPIDTGDIGTTEVEARLADVGLFETYNGSDAKSGVLRPSSTTLVSGTASMTYSLLPSNFIYTRTPGEGVYRFCSVGVTTVATTAAPGSNSRIDVIWVKQNDQSKGDADNIAVLGVTQGTVAPSPVAPTIPTGAMELARATILSTTSATNTASITQTWRYAALRGTPVNVRNTTERAEITAPHVGQQVARLDLDASGRAIERWTGAAWATTPRPPRNILAAAARIGSVSGLQAKIDSGEIQLIRQEGSVVATTDASGYLSFNYPTAFPNGILKIGVSNGDATSSGRGAAVSAAGTPFTQSLATCYVSVVIGAAVVPATGIRVEYDVLGW